MEIYRNIHKIYNKAPQASPGGSRCDHAPACCPTPAAFAPAPLAQGTGGAHSISSASSAASDAEAWPSGLPAHVRAAGTEGRTCCPVHENGAP